jgi:hypothetical protein
MQFVLTRLAFASFPSRITSRTVVRIQPDGLHAARFDCGIIFGCKSIHEYVDLLLVTQDSLGIATDVVTVAELNRARQVVFLFTVLHVLVATKVHILLVSPEVRLIALRSCGDVIQQAMQKGGILPCIYA